MPKFVLVQKEVEARMFMGTFASACDIHEWAKQPVIRCDMGDGTIGVMTPAGEVTARDGDFVVKDSRGDFYVVQEHVFKALFRPA